MKTTKTARLAMLALGLAMFGTTAYVGQAAARGVGASTGNAVSAANAPCFSLFGGGIFNTCGGGARAFEAALPIDNSGGKGVQITHTSGTSCYAFATNRDDTAGAGAPTTTLTTLPSGWIVTSLSGFSAPSFGVLVGGCNVASSGRIHQIDWNQ